MFHVDTCKALKMGTSKEVWAGAELSNTAINSLAILKYLKMKSVLLQAALTTQDQVIMQAILLPTVTTYV